MKTLLQNYVYYNQLLQANVLSFDGTGYIRPKQFVEQRMFVSLNRIEIDYRLNSFEGLLMYL